MSLFNFFKAKRKEPEKPIINYDRVNLDIYHDNAFLRYSYKNILIDTQIVDIQSEGEADLSISGDTVIVNYQGQYFGALDQEPKISRMIIDFKNRGDIVIAKFDGPKSLYIGFYIDYRKKYEAADYETYEIKGAKKKSIIYDFENRQDFYSCLKDWTPLTIEEKENKFLVCLTSGEDIGEISKKDAAKIEESNGPLFTIDLSSDVIEKGDDYIEVYKCNLLVVTDKF